MNISSIASDDIYTYTFEAPAGIYSESAKVSGMYNRINYIDLIPRFVFKQWDFSRAGTDITFPKHGDSGFIESFTKAFSCMLNYLQHNLQLYEIFSCSDIQIDAIDASVKRMAERMESWSAVTYHFKNVFRYVNDKPFNKIKGGIAHDRVVSRSLKRFHCAFLPVHKTTSL